MRVFWNMQEAAKEIRRDLYKAPEVVSTRVQQLNWNRMAHEWMNYSYTILQGGIPESPRELLNLLRGQGFTFYCEMSRRDEADWLQWLKEESMVRIEGDVEGRKIDYLHPMLRDLTEGEEYSYYYEDRMSGLVPHIVSTLEKHLDTRRAYWPIFLHTDAIRAKRMTRIPCSLGYHFMVRRVPGGEDQHLHLTYLQRSMDFEVFWATDLWLAHQLQIRVYEELMERIGEYEEVRMGQLSHVILSLHGFFDPEQEVY